MDIEIHRASETSDQFAVYKDGKKVLEGDWLGDYVEELMKDVIGAKFVDDEAFMLGGEPGCDAADTLAEVRAFGGMPPEEREARQFEEQAKYHQDRAADLLRRAAGARHRTLG